MERRDKATLIPIIKRECERGSLIHSDEWPAYSALPGEGFRHETVNHQQNCVDPITGAHTQGVERTWPDAKLSILKKKRGVPLYLLQSHLDHYCWKMKRKNEPDLFLAFLADVRRAIRLNLLDMNYDETLYRVDFRKTRKQTSLWCLLGNANMLANTSLLW